MCVVCSDDACTCRLDKVLASLGDNKTVVVVVCGGNVISLDLMRAWSEQFNLI
jgi:hypothetical protein